MKIRLESIIILLTSVFAFALPLSTKYSNYLLLVLLLCVFISGIKSNSYRSVTVKNWVSALFQTTFVVFLFLCLGLFYSENVDIGLRLIKHDIYFLLVPLVFIGQNTSVLSKIRKNGFVYFVMGSVLSAIILLVNNFIKFYLFWLQNSVGLGELFSYEFTYHKFARLLDFHPTILGLYYSFALVVLVESKSYFTKRTRVCFESILLLSLIFINSRTAFLFLGIYGLYILVKRLIGANNRSLFLGKLAMFLAIFVAVFFIVLKDTYVYNRLWEQVGWELSENKGTSYDGVYSNDSRMSRWKAIIGKSTEQPFLGFGTGMQKEVVLKSYGDNDLQFALKHEYDPHNYYLYILIENGILGLILFVSFLVYQLYIYCREKDICAVFLMIFIMVGCIFDSILYLTPCILLFTFFSNLFYVQNKLVLNQ